jgi:hypothetical protein
MTNTPEVHRVYERTRKRLLDSARQRGAAGDQRHGWWQAQPVRDVVQRDDRKEHRDQELEQVDSVRPQGTAWFPYVDTRPGSKRPNESRWKAPQRMHLRLRGTSGGSIVTQFVAAVRVAPSR